MEENITNIPEWLLSLFGEPIKEIESLRSEAKNYRSMADQKDLEANAKQAAIENAVRQALGNPSPKQQEVETKLIPTPRNFPTKRPDQLLRFMDDGIIGKCCQATEMKRILSQYDTWKDADTNNVVDNLIYPLRKQKELASAKFNGNNKLVWWMRPSCIESVGGKWRIKPEFMPKHRDIGANPLYEITFGMD